MYLWHEPLVFMPFMTCTHNISITNSSVEGHQASRGEEAGRVLAVPWVPTEHSFVGDILCGRPFHSSVSLRYLQTRFAWQPDHVSICSLYLIVYCTVVSALLGSICMLTDKLTFYKA